MFFLKKFFSRKKSFSNSKTYWENRYNSGGDSGRGSFGRLAEFKAEVLNDFVNINNINTIAEFGCGDSNQLSLYNFPNYIGIDVSETAIGKCKSKFGTDLSKQFFLINELPEFEVELTLSIDVIYHLIEDTIFDSHLEMLFNTTNNYVIIYSSNEDIYNPIAPHVKHRRISEIIEQRYPSFQLINYIPNKYPFDFEDSQTSRANFFIFKLQS